MYTLTLDDLDYVRRIIKKKFKVNEDDFTYDLLYSEGLMALHKCAEKYDPSLGAKFSTYAYKAIIHSMYNVLGSKYVQEFYHNTEDDKDVMDCSYEIDTDEVTEEELNVVKEVQKLPLVDQRIFFDYVAGVSPSVTANREGIHEATVHRARKKIFRRLRACLKQSE